MQENPIPSEFLQFLAFTSGVDNQHQGSQIMDPIPREVLPDPLGQDTLGLPSAPSPASMLARGSAALGELMKMSPGNS